MLDDGSSAGARLEAFSEHRRLLFSIAYRMLGSAADAEDVLQDGYLRWSRADPSAVRSPKDYLVATVTRLAIDHLKSARVRRERYVGPWLPEPLVGVDSHDPLAATELAESLSTAFLVILERLTPNQRAAFLLREVFGLEYREVARIVETSEANARQLIQRAKQHLAQGRPRFSFSATRADELARRFLDACRGGDVDGVLALLSDDAVALADGGGKFKAARRPVVGADRVARFVASVVGKWQSSGEVRIEPVNGGAGLLFHAHGKLRGVMTIGSRDGGRQVGSVFIVMNPEKL